MNALPRFTYLAIVLAPLACGITYSPGDYLTPADRPSLAVVEDAGKFETGPPPEPRDATVPAPDAGFDGARILLVGGHRDALTGESGGANVTETLRTTFTSAGVLGPFIVDAPPPVAASWTHAEIARGTLHVHNATSLVRASFVNGVLGPWSSTAIKPSPGISRPWLLDEHGFLAGPPAGSKATYALPFLPSGELGEWTAKSAQLTVERSEVTLAHAGDLVYALGGRRLAALNPPGDSTVEVAKLGANGDLGNFTALAALGTNPPAAPAEYAAYAPIVATGPGRIVVLGGAATNGAGTDVAFAATITDLTTGALGGWRALPRLPEALAGSALIVTTNHILVFGGQRAAGTSDLILDLALQPDGSYGTTWIPIGRLPAARSGLVAVVY